MHHRDNRSDTSADPANLSQFIRNVWNTYSSRSEVQDGFEVTELGWECELEVQQTKTWCVVRLFGFRGAPTTKALPDKEEGQVVCLSGAVAMIDYKRTNWYGLFYLWRLRGSLLPHCLPAMIFAGTLAGVFASSLLEDWTGLETKGLFVDKYSMQLLGVVFGYLAVARLNVSYNRYWEGVRRTAPPLACSAHVRSRCARTEGR